MVKLHNKYYQFNEITINKGNFDKFSDPKLPGLSKYLSQMPIDKFLVTFDYSEGNTPMIKLSSFGKTLKLTNLYSKLEDKNPTGSFKDRESSLVFSWAKEQGINSVSIASSGNAAISAAAYSVRGQIKCHAYIPASTSLEKIKLLESYNVYIHKIKGTYEDCYKHLVDNPSKLLNITSGQLPLRTEANKTISYEIFEQLGVPDYIVVPCGNGSCFAGIWKGFKELYDCGFANKLPKMISVQIDRANPINKAYRFNQEIEIIHNSAESIAEGIVASESFCSPLVVKGLKESNGLVVDVNDHEIKKALYSIINSEGIIPEPTTASVYAALFKISFNKDDLIVCINTGSGLKYINEIYKLLK